jgi:hypothetical protein
VTVTDLAKDREPNWPREDASGNNLRRFALPQEEELPLDLHDSPLARMQANQLLGYCAELARLVKDRRPVELVARIEREYRGGLSGTAMDGRVSGSRSPKLPALDARDRTLLQRQRDYEKGLRQAINALQLCAGIEADVLVPVHEATEKERRAASDLGVDCECCHRPVACTVADKLLAGMCGACFKRWDRAGKPDRLAWIKQQQEMAG